MNFQILVPLVTFRTPAHYYTYFFGAPGRSNDLKKNAKQIVFSDGDFNSSVMIVGEGPGQKEDEIGKPFVGDAGQLLNKMLRFS